MPTVTISLPDSLKDFVDDQLAVGGFASVSDYFSSLLRNAQTQTALDDEHDAALETLLLQGLASGDGIPVNHEFWADLKAEAKQIAGGQVRLPVL